MTDDETLNYLCTKLEQRTSERLSPLLERGINARDGDGKTALMHATSTLSQPATSLQSLIEAGADVNARDNDGKTALMELAQRYIPASNPILEPEEVQEQIAQTNAAIKLSTPPAIMAAPHSCWQAAEKLTNTQMTTAAPHSYRVEMQKPPKSCSTLAHTSTLLTKKAKPH